jgi:hypothetical protein
MNEITYSENSIFLRLLQLVSTGQGGTTVLRACVEPLIGDAEKIAAFYDDAEKCGGDPAWHEYPVAVLRDALESSGVWIPPVPGSLEDPLTLAPNMMDYADPAAAAAHLAAIMSDTNREIRTLTTNPVPALTTESAPFISTAQTAALESHDISDIHVSGE